MPVIPFSSGTQYADWEDYNCCHCAKYPSEESWQSAEGRARMCPIALAMGEGYFTIPDEIALRAAYPGPAHYSWRCGEFVPDGTETPTPDNAFGKALSGIIGRYLRVK